MINLQIYFEFFSIITGLIFGSFINVITYRLPMNISILWPRSFCPKCKKKILVKENIPVLSWLLLKGKCSNCRKKISIKYPLIEISTGLLFLFSFKVLSNDFENIQLLFEIISGWSLIILLLSISIIDYQYLIIPNLLSIVGIIFGLSFSLFSNFFDNNMLIYNFGDHLVGSISGYLLISLIIKIGKYCFKKPAMGLGDSFLAAMIGAWLGLSGVLISIWLSFLMAGIFVLIGLFLNKIVKGQLVPFAPFLCMSCFLIWIFGEQQFLNLFFSIKF
tara:strand:+ start:935 stop:1759 length:825 start_codon:yes stop_codon:yes gene_type:complete